MAKKDLEVYDPFKYLKKSFFEDFFEPMRSNMFPDIRTPLVDIIDEGNNIKVKVELPGLKKEDINVDAHEDYIKIEGKAKKENKENKKNYYRYEMRSNSFSRTIPMPEKIVSSKVSGELKNGVLELNAPKIHETKKKTSKVKIK
jgi:HSP20 family protein